MEKQEVEWNVLLLTLITSLLQVWLVMLLFLIRLVNICLKSYMKPPLFPVHSHISTHIIHCIPSHFSVIYIYIYIYIKYFTAKFYTLYVVL